MKTRYKVDLPGLQADHEANYQRLLRLTPGLYRRERWRYIVGNDNRNDSHVAIRVKERTKYTTTIHLFQRCRPDSIYHNNSVTVRLYHDAHLAEVISWQPYNRFRARYDYPNHYMHQCDEKARLNSFLGELLTHCLLHGRVAKAILPATVSG